MERTSREEWADTFGGESAPQDVVAALGSGGEAVRELAELVVRVIYGPVLQVHWVSIKQLAVLEPTVTETVTCMLSGFLRDVLAEAVGQLGLPEAAARAIMLGHIQVALANSLRSSNPFSDAALIAMEYGRTAIIREDWKRIFDYDELDKLLAKMLHIDKVERVQTGEEATRTVVAS